MAISYDDEIEEKIGTPVQQAVLEIADDLGELTKQLKRNSEIGNNCKRHLTASQLRLELLHSNALVGLSITMLVRFFVVMGLEDAGNLAQLNKEMGGTHV